ncbi:unnamed protein product [Urochloa humidicola]
MGLDIEVFANSGPRHMMMVKSGTGPSPTTIMINWDSAEHRRCIAACMVRGTYVMETDRTKRRLGTSRALAPAWWESFSFRLRDARDVLDCECDCVFCNNRFKFGAQRWSIYGAILERVPAAHGDRRHPPAPPSAPRYIVAFRGTMPPWHRGDMHANIEMLVNRQHDCRRFCHARSKVGELLNSIAYSGGGAAAVWLAGHSLGASIALDVGRDMATKGCYLQTFLFNPPQVSVAPLLNTLRVPDVARRFLYRISYTVKAKMGAMAMLRPFEKKMEELFERLAPWVPELFVHERDFVCRGFIDYFEQRQNMLGGCGSAQIALVGTKLSLRDMLLFLHAENKEEKPVQPHLLPSARMWKTSIQGHRHDLQQWLKPDWALNLNSRLYRYPGA